MRISDWSSDVCSSDLVHLRRGAGSCRCLARDRRRQSRWPRPAGPRLLLPHRRQIEGPAHAVRQPHPEHVRAAWRANRKREVQGKRVYVSVVLGGRRISEKTTTRPKRQWTLMLQIIERI